MKELVPAKGRILVQEDKFKYEGRIIVPDQSKRRPTTGVVIAIGKDVDGYNVGDHLIYNMYSGSGLRFRGKDGNEKVPMRMLVPDEILGVLIGDELELIESGA